SRSCSGIRAVTLQVTSSPHIPPNRKPARLCKPPCMVKGTQCTVNVVLCTRLALMRAVFIKYPDCKFWNKFNRPLAKVRADAGSDPKKKLAKGFRYYLEEDQKTRGPTGKADRQAARTPSSKSIQLHLAATRAASTMLDG
ncbi:hypothetical protein B0H14DRAFT_3617428, partial [Mycena olivaceomarginata]